MERARVDYRPRQKSKFIKQLYKTDRKRRQPRKMHKPAQKLICSIAAFYIFIGLYRIIHLLRYRKYVVSVLKKYLYDCLLRDIITAIVFQRDKRYTELIAPVYFFVGDKIIQLLIFLRGLKKAAITILI